MEIPKLESIDLLPICLRMAFLGFYANGQIFASSEIDHCEFEEGKRMDRLNEEEKRIKRKWEQI